MKKLAILAVVIAMALAAVLPVAAQKAPDCGVGMTLPAAMMKLHLTPQQKKDIAGVLKEYQEPLGAAADRMLAARGLLKEALSQAQPQATQVKAAYQELADAGQQLTLTLAQALPKLRAVLTPEQQAIMASFRESRFQRNTCLIQDGRGLLRQWIQEQGV